MAMQIDEFMREVNKVACAVYNKKLDTLTIYADEDYIDTNTWLLVLTPSQRNIVYSKSLDSTGNMQLKDLIRVLSLVQAFNDTPVDERFPKKKYCLLTRNNKFVNGVNREELYLGRNNVSLIRWGDKRRTWSSEQLEALSKMTNIPMPVIDYWKLEVKDGEQDA